MYMYADTNFQIGVCTLTLSILLVCANILLHYRIFIATYLWTGEVELLAKKLVVQGVWRLVQVHQSYACFSFGKVMRMDFSHALPACGNSNVTIIAAVFDIFKIWEA